MVDKKLYFARMPFYWNLSGNFLRNKIDNLKRYNMMYGITTANETESSSSKDRPEFHEVQNEF